jgi:t-SNARE complex subunit (syntaxin)
MSWSRNSIQLIRKGHKKMLTILAIYIIIIIIGMAAVYEP